MAEASTHEPTMEEILASIRRIISEDDNTDDQASKKPADVEDVKSFAEPMQDVEEEVLDEEDVLELTDVQGKDVSSLGDLDIYETAEVVVPPIPEPKQPVYQMSSSNTEERVSAAFGALSSAMLMPKSSKTLEEFIADLTKPYIKEWLDQNLARIVEDEVRREIERVSRSAR